MELCYYGCGREAKYYFPTVNKWCCENNYHKCPEQRRIYSIKLTGYKFKLVSNIESSKNLCKYGCGQVGKYTTKNGEFCCSYSWNKCPVNKKRNKGFSGKEHSPETKEKIRQSKTGKNNPNYGKSHSEDWKRKISKTMKGKTTWNKGKKLSEEYKKKISETLKGREFTEEHKRKISESLRKLEPGILATFKGKRHTKETKRKMRLNAIKRCEDKYGRACPNYNQNACKIIDEYGKKHEYNFQHAENGGEFHIKELVYWVDGYDKEKNVVIEVDEKDHFNRNGNLKEKDVQRQKEIADFLKCKFIRIKLETGEVYQC